MGNIIRNIIELLVISSIIIMGVSTGLFILNTGESDVEFIVENKTFKTASSMDFSSITIDSNYIKFNDTGFYIDSINPITISVSYIHTNTITAGDGDRVLSFSADASSGTVWFNISGFIPGTSYTVKKDNLFFITVSAGGSGLISFSNNVWSTHVFEVYQQGESNNPPNIANNPSPVDTSSNVAIDVLLSWSGGDLDGDSVTYDVYLDMVNPPVSKQAGNQSSTTFNPGVLSYDTVYYWQIVSWDEHGAEQLGNIWSFSTIANSTEIFIQISDVFVTFSTPMDTSIGWENLSCDVSTDTIVEAVWLNLKHPDGSSDNISMISADDDTYYSNTTLSSFGIYEFYIFAKDTDAHTYKTANETFTIYANWDINPDGTCNSLDLVAVSNKYGLSGPPGWVREDVDNNGRIEILDLTLVASQYEFSYNV